MEFSADSLTVGACNEDGDTDQVGQSPAHTTPALSYAALTANAFSVRLSQHCRQRHGHRHRLWVDKRPVEVWNQNLSQPASPRADLTQWCRKSSL